MAHEGKAQPSVTVQSLLSEEAEWGVDRIEFYLNFGRRVEQIKKALRAMLESLKGDGKRAPAYGAAAKGTVLLNYCGIGKDFIEFVVDRNPYKQGRYMPGVRLPICAPSQLLEAMPDYTLLLLGILLMKFWPCKQSIGGGEENSSSLSRRLRLYEVPQGST